MNAPSQSSPSDQSKIKQHDPLPQIGQSRRWFDLLGTTLGPLLGLLLVISLFWGLDLINSQQENKQASFATVDSLQIVLLHTSAVGTAALGMTLIIIAGGIDLSAGTAIAG